MTFRLDEHGVRAILLDIEGTTTPIGFVYDVLFPFARAHLREYLQAHAEADQTRDALGLLRREWAGDAQGHSAPPPWPDGGADAAIPYINWLMDQDRKSPGLKLLQGVIWQQGYRDGALRGEVFSDVRPAFERWKQRGLGLAIYSSGSVLAQQLLFSTTRAGDLTAFVDANFDTGSGPKTSPESYKEIVDRLGRREAETLFVSDAALELEAARAAGLQVLLAVRPGNRPAAGSYERITSFDEIT